MHRKHIIISRNKSAENIDDFPKASSYIPLQTEAIAKELPQTCQTIMFSATMPEKIEDLAKTLLKNPIEIKLAVSKPAEKIKQSAYICYETQKLGIIKDIFKAGDLKRVIVFCGSKTKVKQVNSALQRKHINSGEMHSDLTQEERNDIMYKFKAGQLDVLVATDIVSRGIDIDDMTDEEVFLS